MGFNLTSDKIYVDESNCHDVELLLQQGIDQINEQLDDPNRRSRFDYEHEYQGWRTSAQTAKTYKQKELAQVRRFIAEIETQQTRVNSIATAIEGKAVFIELYTIADKIAREVDCLSDKEYEALEDMKRFIFKTWKEYV